MTYTIRLIAGMQIIQEKYQNSSVFVLVASLLIILLLRGSTLEFIDLIDPTESRYAYVAQEMVTSHDWVTPKLAEPEGVVPYLGKPPLHYWLTAVSYSLFSVEEWTARFPSFVGGIFIIGCLITFGKRIFTLETGLLAALVFVSSPLVYLFVGASVVDITFTLFLTCAFVAFALGVKENRQFPFYIYFASLGLAFLTKGPLALVLGGVPILAWLAISSERKFFKKIPWIKGALLFSIIIIPWFALTESRNPGFLYYFFVNENFLRYIVADYGDKYGNGHIYFRGSSFWMFAVATLPWFIYACWLLYKTKISRKEFTTTIFDDRYKWELYCGLWGIFPVLFFALAKQLQMAYMIPAIPPLSLLFISWGSNVAKSVRPFSSHVLRYANALCLIFTLVIFLFGTYASNRKSTEEILKLIARRTKTSTPLVGSTAVNCYSQYWVTKAWRQELGEPVTIKYVAPENIRNSGLEHLILRKGFEESNPKEYLNGYRLIRTIGKWSWWRKAQRGA